MVNNLMVNNLLDAWSSFALLPWNSTSSKPPSSGGDFLSGVHDGGERALHYRLFIPSGERGQPMPLVVMLHGCGQDATDFARGTGMNELAETCGCLVLYPEQPCSAHWNRCWNWYDQAHHQRGEGEPALIAGLTRHIMAEHAVDVTRVAVAGLSSGGAMAVILGRTYPDLFSAVGCHSGMAHGSATNGAVAMLVMRDGPDQAALAQPAPHAGAPVIVFHGDADTTVHRENGSGVVRQSLDSHALRHPGTGIAVREETGCSGGRAFTRRIHQETNGRVLAEHWTVHGTGHAWSGGDLRGSFTDTQGPSASEEMLRFFIGRPAAA